MTKKKSQSNVRRRGGRPSHSEAPLIEGRILDAATDLFFTQGYGATSIEAIATRARVSKRTFYDRFDHKAAIFKAVVHRVVRRLRPPDTARLFKGKNVEDLLQQLAPLILRASLTPEALALHRLILAEAHRFPELALAVNAEGARREATGRIAELLQQAVEEGRFKIDDCGFAAEQFLQMVISLPQRRAMGLGRPMTAAELKKWAQATVALFLDGCRGKSA